MAKGTSREDKAGQDPAILEAVRLSMKKRSMPLHCVNLITHYCFSPVCHVCGSEESIMLIKKKAPVVVRRKEVNIMHYYLAFSLHFVLMV
ncbi:hypothetical protein DPMN_121615 [Dreissena polymorpha]|uniref:Uncharacterized protein n=1 Tax=Dreissena polymorpha TaxID=45954 RepID=A0A9D4JTA5_DREPO|nr:hypothetical protein DPMN_121615 [Dreissena polymorpha]